MPFNWGPLQAIAEKGSIRGTTGSSVIGGFLWVAAAALLGLMVAGYFLPMYLVISVLVILAAILIYCARVHWVLIKRRDYSALRSEQHVESIEKIRRGQIGDDLGGVWDPNAEPPDMWREERDSPKGLGTGAQELPPVDPPPAQPGTEGKK